MSDRELRLFDDAVKPEERSAARVSRKEKFNDYEGFVAKFQKKSKPKLTTDDCMTPEPVYEERILTFDNIVVSGGRKGRTELADSFAEAAPVVKVVGDTLRVSNIKRAIYSGYKAAMQL